MINYLERKFIDSIKIQAEMCRGFIALTRCCTNWRCVATLHWAGPLAALSQQHLLILCLCHILVVLTIFQSFLLLLYLLWWSVISDIWCYYCNCLGEPWIMPIKEVNLIDKNVCVLTAPLTGHSYISLHLPGQPSFLRHNNMKLDQLTTFQWSLSVHLKGRATCLILNQKPVMIKLSEEDVSKAEIGQKPGLLGQTARQVVNAKAKFLKELQVLLHWTHKW